MCIGTWTKTTAVLMSWSQQSLQCHWLELHPFDRWSDFAMHFDCRRIILAGRCKLHTLRGGNRLSCRRTMYTVRSGNIVNHWTGMSPLHCWHILCNRWRTMHRLCSGNNITRRRNNATIAQPGHHLMLEDNVLHVLQDYMHPLLALLPVSTAASAKGTQHAILFKVQSGASSDLLSISGCLHLSLRAPCRQHCRGSDSSSDCRRHLLLSTHCCGTGSSDTVHLLCCSNID